MIAGRTTKRAVQAETRPGGLHVMLKKSMPYLKIRVTPGARKEEIAGWLGDALRVRVKAPPERGKATNAAINLVAKALDIPPRQISLERGAASRDKLVLIEGLTKQEIYERLPERADTRPML